MKIFSLFSGIGGFELGIIKAFWKENVEVIGFCEIDKFSSAVLAHRFPWVKNYGDVSQIDTDTLPDFDILVGGSPCQDLSIAKREREGLLGNRSGLFLEYVRILREKKPALFVLENVASMSKTDRDFISETLGVEPIMINSALLTAQNRKRYYRTNIPNVSQPKDANIGIQDILETNVEEKYFYDWQAKKGKQIVLSGNEITPCPLIEVRTEKGKIQREKNMQLFGIDSNKRNKETVQYIAWPSDKANCLTGGIRAINMFIVQKEDWFGTNSLAVRSPTPIETERLQGFSDNRTLVPYKNKMMSDYQRFKQTGNAVTVNVIAHIFSFLKTHLESTKKGYQSSDLPSWFVTPLVVSKRWKSKKNKLNQTGYVAYCKIPQKKGFTISSQRAIIEHFTKMDKTTLFTTIIDDGNNNALKDAIAYCMEHQVIFIIATLDCLSNDVDFILSIKKKLGGLFKSCDLITSDSLTLSIVMGLKDRAKELVSIRTKAALRTKKAEGKTFGNPQNLTAKGRELGLAKIRAKVEKDSQPQKILDIIKKCRKAWMGLGKIADSLNEFGYRTSKGNRFYKMTIKRYISRLTLDD